MRISRTEPVLLGPPARYSADDTVERDGSVYVPGFFTSPTTLMANERIWPRDIRKKVVGSSLLIPEKILPSATLSVFSACSMVWPIRYTGPSSGTMMLPSGDIS